MSATSPTTEITLHQLVLRVGDAAPEGHVFESQADALVEAARSARQHLDQFWEIDARNILDDGDRRTDPIVDLALVADDECIRLANAWDGASFEAIISPITVEVTIASLAQAIRAAGSAVCIFQPSDVTSSIDTPDEAGDWLLSHCDELESSLSTHGNEWIDMRLECEGRLAAEESVAPERILVLTWRDEDYGAFSGSAAAFRASSPAAPEDISALEDLYRAYSFTWSGDRAAWITYHAHQAPLMLEALKVGRWTVVHRGRWPNGPPISLETEAA